jgi:nitric oxide reductase NorQ protein
MLKEKYAPLGPTTGATLWETITDVLAAPYNEDAAMRLNSEVIPQGRYVERASGAARKPRGARTAVAAMVDAMEGEEAYARPNGQNYFARMWGEHADVLALRKAREATITAVTTGVGSPLFTLLYGAPGCGKTALVEAAFGEDMRTLMGTGDTEVADLVGGYVQNLSGGFEWVDGDLLVCAENGWVYFIDEIGLIDPKVLSAVYGLMDGRREITVTANPERGTVKAHPDFYVVAATNPNAPGVRLSEALLSRFTVQAEMTTDWNLARKLGVPTTMVTCAQNLAKKQASGEVSWAPQFRELLAFRDASAVFGQDWAVSNLIAAAPEIDRPVVCDVITRAFGKDYQPAVI